MPDQLKNIEILQRIGKTNVCIFGYFWEDDRKLHLQSMLEKNGFRVWFSNDKDDLLKLDNNLQDTLLLVTNRTSLMETVETKMNEIGAADRLFIYDFDNNRIMKYSKPVLLYMEYHVAWHCNLRCKGCSHYCNLYDRPKFGDPVKYRENLLRLRELFDNIVTLRLMGGEPFLNPELSVFVQISREVFPDTDLRVVSNGLLIPKVDDAVLNSLKQHRASVDISNYHPTARILDKITDRLYSAGVRYKASKEIFRFRLIADNVEKDGTYNFNHCFERHCHFLHDDGRFSMCGIPCFYDEVKDKLRAAKEVSEKNWVNIYRAEDGFEILREFNREIPFCTYCLNKNPVLFPWQGNYTKELTEE